MGNIDKPFYSTLEAGELVITTMGPIEHESIVSDRTCELGKPMLISATLRTGTVKEEPYDTVVAGRATRRSARQSNLAASLILERARWYVGKWNYNFATANCEQFASLCAGLPPKSRQVSGVLTGATGGVVVAALIEKPISLKGYCIMAIAGGIIGLAIAQATNVETRQVPS